MQALKQHKKIRIFSVVGARPNFMKMAPVWRAFETLRHSNPDLAAEMLLVHTGQHYDNKMDGIFFEELKVPRPEINLGVGSGSHAEQTAKIMVAFEKLCLEHTPDLVIVYGDVNSTLACTLTAAKLQIPVAHVEAGLRSFDRSMPEEINRIVTDSLSSYLFTSCSDADENLRQEGISEDKVYFVGNTMIDTLYQFLPQTGQSKIKKELGLEKSPYALVTLHRPSNVDDPNDLKKLIAALVNISNKIQVVFPIHPRTNTRLNQLNGKIGDGYRKKLLLTDPLGYIDCLSLMKDARMVLTDSGGVQEETTVLGVPCITLRENTERPVTLREGTNTLVGKDGEKLLATADQILKGCFKIGKVPSLWDGKAGERIVEILAQVLRR